jgi:hypothetical protein
LICQGGAKQIDHHGHLLALIVGPCLARDDAEVPDGCPAARRGVRHALSDEGAKFMAATMRQGPTRFPQNDFHVRFGAMGELCHSCHPRGHLQNAYRNRAKRSAGCAF